MICCVGFGFPVSNAIIPPKPISPSTAVRPEFVEGCFMLRNRIASRIGLFINIFQGFTRQVVVTVVLVGVGLAVQVHH